MVAYLGRDVNVWMTAIFQKQKKRSNPFFENNVLMNGNGGYKTTN